MQCRSSFMNKIARYEFQIKKYKSDGNPNAYENRILDDYTKMASLLIRGYPFYTNR